MSVLDLPELKTVYMFGKGVINGIYGEDVMEFPNLSIFIKGNDSYRTPIMGEISNVRVLNFPFAQKITGCTFNGMADRMPSFYSMPKLEEFYAENLEEAYSGMGSYTSNERALSMFRGCPKLKKMITKIHVCGNGSVGHNGLFYDSCTELMYFKIGRVDRRMSDDIINKNQHKLIHFEIEQGSSYSLYFSYWNPQLAFNTDSDLVTDSFCSNNFEQFLYNFRIYIIDRLTDRTGGSELYVYLMETTKNVILGEDESQYALHYYMPGEQINYVDSLNIKLVSINWGLA